MSQESSPQSGPVQSPGIDNYNSKKIGTNLYIKNLIFHSLRNLDQIGNVASYMTPKKKTNKFSNQVTVAQTTL